jgi:mRNA-degrading endonuclease RelE of RelBE toxin-antitoxin system
MVTVTMTSDAREQLSELPRLIALRMEKLLTRLGQWPDVSGVKHLRGDLSGQCRLRTGDYRIQFRVHEKKKTIKLKQTVKELRDNKCLRAATVRERVRSVAP